jgi:uncharacterized membrane protein YagU involved in acid resistance
MRPILLGTLVVGALDIAEVILFYAFRDVKPIRILQSVATGLLGRDAFKGGIPTAILGLALHFFIAFVVVTVYYLASRRLEVLRRHPAIAGAIYGLLVYAFMNFAVLPLSAAGPPNFSSWPAVANGLFAHVFCVGIPAAVMTTQLSS